MNTFPQGERKVGDLPSNGSILPNVPQGQNLQGSFFPPNVERNGIQAPQPYEMNNNFGGQNTMQGEMRPPTMPNQNTMPSPSMTQQNGAPQGMMIPPNMPQGGSFTPPSGGSFTPPPSNFTPPSSGGMPPPPRPEGNASQGFFFGNLSRIFNGLLGN